MESATQFQNLNKAVHVSPWDNAIKKGMNSSLLLPAMTK